MSTSTSQPTTTSQTALQSLTATYRTLEATLQTHISTRQRLSAQLQENASVAREFQTLKSSTSTSDDAPTIYKMIGPVLLKQDRDEAILGVEGRLEFIRGEM